MPPRSFYIEPRIADYLAFIAAYFPHETQLAIDFSNETGLPYIESEDHIAAYLGVSPSLVRQILHKPGYHYRAFTIAKNDGSERRIATPKTYLKVLHWWICDNILNRVQLADSVHGFTRGRSFITNARAHLGSNHILNLDIEQFFPSITDEMVYQEYLGLGYSDDAARLLTRLCTLGGCTPTGAPTSPSIGNLVLSGLDRDLQVLANLNGLKYTRYADDLTFSSSKKIPSMFVDLISQLVERNGFKVNTRKTKFMGRGDRMDVTGVVINSLPNLPREWRNWARGFLHRVAKNPKEYEGQWTKVSGVYGSLKSIDPEERMRLTQQAKSTLDLLRR